MVTYRIRKRNGRLASAPVIDRDGLYEACERANEECYGVCSTYDAYEYTDNKLTNVFQFRVVRPSSFKNCSLPNLMKQLKI